MKKRLAITLGLLMLGSLGQASSSVAEAYREYRLVCAGSPEDLTRKVNEAVSSDKNRMITCWYVVGPVIITNYSMPGNGNSRILTYCQTLIRKC